MRCMSTDTLDTAEIEKLFHEFSDTSIERAERNPGGFANDVYDITDSENQQYVMRVLKAQPAEIVNTEAQMQMRLAAAGIGTPAYLKTRKDSYIGAHGEARCTLSKRIPGSAPASASLLLIKDFAAVTGRLHTALDGIIPGFSTVQWLSQCNMQEAFSGYDGPLKSDIKELLDTSNRLFDLGLPEAVIHADLWLGNVHAHDDAITAVFDLETAERTVRILDLARTFLSMRLETDFSARDIRDALFAGYNSTANSPLNDRETLHFNLAIVYVAGICALWHAAHKTPYAESYAGFGQEALRELS